MKKLILFLFIAILFIRPGVSFASGKIKTTRQPKNTFYIGNRMYGYVGIETHYNFSAPRRPGVRIIPSFTTVPYPYKVTYRRIEKITKGQKGRKITFSVKFKNGISKISPQIVPYIIVYGYQDTFAILHGYGDTEIKAVDSDDEHLYHKYLALVVTGKESPDKFTATNYSGPGNPVELEKLTAKGVVKFKGHYYKVKIVSGHGRKTKITLLSKNLTKQQKHNFKILGEFLSVLNKPIIWTVAWPNHAGKAISKLL